MPPTAPTAKQVAEFLRNAINQFKPLTGKLEDARYFLEDIFDSEWAEYYFGKWKYMKKSGGIPRWICNVDTSRTKVMLEELFFGVEYPKIEISNETREWSISNDTGYTEEELEATERGHHPIGYAHYAWQHVVLHKFSVYCLNNCDNHKMVGKKKYDCTDWGWAAWFMAITEMEQEEFSQLIITSR